MLVLRETFTNATAGYSFGTNEIPLSHTYDLADDFTMGKLYRYGRDEYGRPVSKAYIDTAGGDVFHIGYVFEKRDRYEDTGESYLRQVWVTIADRIPARLQYVDPADLQTIAEEE